MTLHIEAKWSKPVSLTLSNEVREIYTCADFESVPTNPGVYIFARRHGRAVTPLYVGQSGNLRKRLCQHLKSVPLMKSIHAAPTGSRIFIFCEPILRNGQQLPRVLDTLEDALIDHALAEGYALFNVQGTKRPAHTIDFSGNRTSEALAPRTMLLKAF